MIAYKEIDLKKVPKEAFLHLGRVGQSDQTFINNTMLHETRNDPEKLRNYEVPIEALHTDMNFLIVTITDDKRPGDLLGPEDELYFEADEAIIPISGIWKYYIQEKKSRSINYSEFNDNDELTTKFVAYNSGIQNEQNISKINTSDPDLIRIQLKAVRNEMKYNQNELVVAAGKTVEIVFENLDLMQHNLLIIAPGSLEVVGKAADALAQLPEGQEKQYVPDVPQILYTSPLVDPSASFVIRFTAPQEADDYPFVCTFPKH